MKIKAKPFEVLQRHLKFLKKQNPLISVRSISREMEVSPSFLNDVFKGKRPFPLARLNEIAKALKMDAISKENLRESLERELRSKNPILKTSKVNVSKSKMDLEGYEQIPMKAGRSLLSQWYNIALMDLVTCINFSPDNKALARRLELTEIEVQKAFDLLSKEGFIKLVEGSWQKTSQHTRVPTRHSIDVVRRFHAQMIQLAYKKLKSSEISDQDFQDRLINGVTFAANLENIEKAKAHLNKALYEAAEIMAEGDCTEVYQLNCQLFALTKPKLT